MWERDTTVKSAMTGHLFTQSIRHYRGYPPPQKKYRENFFDYLPYNENRLAKYMSTQKLLHIPNF